MRYEKILFLKKKYKFNIIEDACHALGARYNDLTNNKVGNSKYSDLSVFSFHPVKNITTGEGGMVTTNNRKLYEKLKILKNHGIVRKRIIKKLIIGLTKSSLADLTLDLMISSAPLELVS